MTPSLKTGPEPGRDGPVVILGTGSRKLQDKEFVRESILEAVYACIPAGEVPYSFEGMAFRHGDAPGFDKVAAREARELGMDIDRCPADWRNCCAQCRPGHRKTRPDGSDFCPTAGHRRNQRMVDKLPRPTLVIACPVGGAQGSRGTFDCAARADRAGLPVYWFEVDSAEPKPG